MGLKANVLQVGSDTGTNDKQFHWRVPMPPDGRLILSRGIEGAPSSDILIVDANGRVHTEPVRLKAKLNPAGGFPTNTLTVPNVSMVKNVGGVYAPTQNVWTPPAGDYLYSINCVASGANINALIGYVRINNVTVETLFDHRGLNVTDWAASGSTMITVGGADTVQFGVYPTVSSGAATIGVTISAHYVGG